MIARKRSEGHIIRGNKKKWGNSNFSFDGDSDSVKKLLPFDRKFSYNNDSVECTVHAIEGYFKLEKNNYLTGRYVSNAASSMAHV